MSLPGTGFSSEPWVTRKSSTPNASSYHTTPRLAPRPCRPGDTPGEGDKARLKEVLNQVSLPAMTKARPGPYMAGAESYLIGSHHRPRRGLLLRSCPLGNVTMLTIDSVRDQRRNAIRRRMPRLTFRSNQFGDYTNRSCTYWCPLYRHNRMPR